MSVVHRPIPGVPMYLQRSRMPERGQWIPFLVSWEPLYLEGYGNAVFVQLEDGRQAYLGLTAGAVFAAVASYYFIDTSDIRRWYTACTRLSQSPPLIIASRGLAFFAVKTRDEPHYRNDGVMGYISNRHISRIEVTGERALRVHLLTGRPVDVRMSKAHFEDQRIRAQVFQYYLASEGVIHSG